MDATVVALLLGAVLAGQRSSQQRRKISRLGLDRWLGSLVSSLPVWLWARVSPFWRALILGFRPLRHCRRTKRSRNRSLNGSRLQLAWLTPLPCHSLAVLLKEGAFSRAPACFACLSWTMTVPCYLNRSSAYRIYCLLRYGRCPYFESRFSRMFMFVFVLVSLMWAYYFAGLSVMIIKQKSQSLWKLLKKHNNKEICGYSILHKGTNRNTFLGNGCTYWQYWWKYVNNQTLCMHWIGVYIFVFEYRHVEYQMK